MLGTNVMVVIKGCVSTAVSLQEKERSSLYPCVCVCVWITLFMFHLSLADVSWVKLNSWQWGGEITARILFYVWGQDFSWPALIPWLSALRCCWWIMTKVEGETGFSWVTGPRNHCQPVGLNRIATSLAGRTEKIQKTKLFCTVHDTLYAVIQISCLILLFSSTSTGELQVSAAPHKLE